MNEQPQLTCVAMHPATKSYLKKQNFIETQRDSTDVEFDTYQGRRVVVDDGCPVADSIYTNFHCQPAIKRQLKKGWVHGQFMMTISGKEIQESAPKIL